jgi:hypothetical protein
MIRVCIVALFIGWGYHKGGWWGAFSMLLISGIVLPLFSQGMGMAREERNPKLPDDNAYAPARRGKRVDPTRPTHEDYAAMMTDNFKGRKR